MQNLTIEHICYSLFEKHHFLNMKETYTTDIALQACKTHITVLCIKSGMSDLKSIDLSIVQVSDTSFGYLLGKKK